MKRRGRPPYPDILTPRQQEVLALLRDGLTNPQIAERLGISLDGAKFLVGEVISRLGVADRAEAARWQPAVAAPAPASKLAWAMAPIAILRKITPSWLPPAVSGAIIVGALAGIGVLAWAVVSMGGSGRQETGVVPSTIGAANPNEIIFTTRAPGEIPGTRNKWVVNVYDVSAQKLMHTFEIGDGTDEQPVEVVAAGHKLVANLSTRIVRYDIDGTNATELRRARDSGRFIGIGASPDGGLIAFTEQTQANWPTLAPSTQSTPAAYRAAIASVTSIGVIETATGAQVMSVPQSDRQFDQFVGQAAEIIWRRDGKRFVVSGYTYSEAPGGIATVMLDGRVIPYEGSGYRSLLSPDAQYVEVGSVTYVCGLGGTYVRHTIQVQRVGDSSVARELSDATLNLTPVEWSPDGSQLLYSTAVLVPGSPDPNCVVEDPASVKWFLLDLSDTSAEPTPVSGPDDARTRWYGSRAIQYRCHGEVVLQPHCSSASGGEAPADAFVGGVQVGSGIDWRIVQLIPASSTLMPVPTLAATDATTVAGSTYPWPYRFILTGPLVAAPGEDVTYSIDYIRAQQDAHGEPGLVFAWNPNSADFLSADSAGQSAITDPPIPGQAYLLGNDINSGRMTVHLRIRTGSAGAMMVNIYVRGTGIQLPPGSVDSLVTQVIP